jgi:hypothetical protein
MSVQKTDIPGYTTGIPDLSNWRLAAQALKVRPFYEGHDAVPFDRLRAREVPDPTRGNAPANDFYLEQA